MPLCSKCHQREVTHHFTRLVDGQERANLHLCAECARPIQARQEANTRGQQKCAFCGGAAFNALPGASAIVYACCQCRSKYARIFFDASARSHPELLERSKRDIFFFEMCADAKLERL